MKLTYTNWQINDCNRCQSGLSWSRCHNVIIDGLPETEKERWSESEDKMLTFVRDKLDLELNRLEKCLKQQMVSLVDLIL